MKEMIDPIQAAAPVGPAAASTPQDDERHDPPSQAPAASTQAEPDRLALTIQRADNGVFFYSLTDPDTGRTVVVIPSVHATKAPTADYQAGEYVSVTA